ncbi:ImmA/IrrE family metallo-endopeptidase [Alkalibaculum sp. M08DMB]|uniref:ImmA/IrrE family metallo-endopeptidase n=1 Tax=Alkalibaculum sporogenes TaxID=2655001 RepID=A0A6A7KAL1_9FIRM|nr:ImmA/IrrE family metallo-endopeptidase [Alkalibaculum sporogenes]MPW26227.1 ImmA/IrrE family metallo-endopeptidase [Alkalibaculum sporogenes]
MGKYEKLLNEAENKVIVIEKYFKSDAKGLCKGRKVGISKAIQTSHEKVCILAEELGHYYTTCGEIIDQSILDNRRQERRARAWAYEKLVPISSFINAYERRLQGRHELAELLDVTEDFINEALEHYKGKYGLYINMGEYTIMFEPLHVIKKIRGGMDG